MYGFVNQAIKEFVVDYHGEEVWHRIQDTAGTAKCPFISGHIYEDQLTYDLVDAITKELHVSADQALEVFGEYWVKFVEGQGFGALLTSNGRDFREFLANLDQFHARVANSYPKCQPPSFEYEDRADGGIDLYYSSERPGLAPMVLGIIQGLAKWYGEEIEVELRESTDVARFEIRIKEQSQAGV